MSKIAILLSTYNGEKYLETQINSLLNQTVANDIIICVRDDGSNDNTLSVLKKYEANKNIRLQSGSNIGVVMSFFNLLESAPDVDYYAFCDQDDYWLPNKVEVAISKLQCIEQPALYCSRKIIVDENLKELPRKDVEPLFGFLDILMKRNIASGCTMVFNKALRKCFMHYHPTSDLSHDVWLFILGNFVGKVIYDRNSYILYRQHGDNVVGAIVGGFNYFMQRIKNIDFTFKRYAARDKASKYSTVLYNNYMEYLPNINKQRIYDVAHARNSFKCRLRLFFSGGLSIRPFYEYLTYKMFILLGWL